MIRLLFAIIQKTCSHTLYVYFSKRKCFYTTVDKSTEWHNSTINYRGVDSRVYSKRLLIIHTNARARERRGSGGEAARPLEADEVFVFKTVIFNASAAVLHEMNVLFSCFFCAQVYGFTVRFKLLPFWLLTYEFNVVHVLFNAAQLRQSELTLFHIPDINNSNSMISATDFLISTIRYVDIRNSGCWYQEFAHICDIRKLNCWYQQIEFLI